MPEMTAADVLRGAVPILVQHGRNRDGWFVADGWVYQAGRSKICAAAAMVLAAGHVFEHNREVARYLNTSPVREAGAHLVLHLGLPRTPAEVDKGDDLPELVFTRVASWSDNEPDDAVVFGGLLNAAEALDGKRIRVPLLEGPQ